MSAQLDNNRHNFRSHAYQSALSSAPASRHTESIGRIALAQFLGGSSGLQRAEADQSQDTMVGVRVDLAPMDTLYLQGSSNHYVYAIESGLLQCHSQPNALVGLPDMVNYAGPREWVGLYDHQGRRQESVHAVTCTSLLAVRVKALRAMSDSSPLIAELLSRRTAVARGRGWRIVCRLRNLPPYTRTVVGLVYLVRLVDATTETARHDTTMKVALDVAMLGHWLGLSLPTLHQCLSQLQRYGALRCSTTGVTELSPQVLLSASRAMSYLTHGDYMAEPARSGCHAPNMQPRLTGPSRSRHQSPLAAPWPRGCAAGICRP